MHNKAHIDVPSLRSGWPIEMQGEIRLSAPIATGIAIPVPIGIPILFAVAAPETAAANMFGLASRMDLPAGWACQRDGLAGRMGLPAGWTCPRDVGGILLSGFVRHVPYRL